ncbi:hypothetical protein EYE40_11790 [Glaciihabitans arcticus]|uniref:Uncharacterized protein n=1 Tax=Glaciihabitans arcticus TaxID=2668039 RepID=A0A4Q9GWQ3_9MICO|nr:hypothetical protein [Glaciihabitans arcticus]TBN58018.1 hypothetical protein EYE40_11790 [Glaciihabitans arcticus]
MNSEETPIAPRGFLRPFGHGAIAFVLGALLSQPAQFGFILGFFVEDWLGLLILAGILVAAVGVFAVLAWAFNPGRSRWFWVLAAALWVGAIIWFGFAGINPLLFGGVVAASAVLLSHRGLVPKVAAVAIPAAAIAVSALF